MKKSVFDYIKKQAESAGFSLEEMEGDGTCTFVHKDFYCITISTDDLDTYHLEKWKKFKRVAVFEIPDSLDDFKKIAELLQIFSSH